MALIVDTPAGELDSIAATAAELAAPLAALSPRRRAAGLLAVADALDAAGDDLVPVAMAETGLAEPRLRGELRRTTVQLRLFAEVAAAGSFLDVRIDEADPDFAIGPRPDVRRFLAPVGPVLNFAASNFPFAFSVPGGDTAAALTAGCPVVVKVHPGHPETSVRVAEVMTAALDSAGFPAGTLQLVFGQQPGVDLLQDRRIRAACFTGSVRAGRLLADLAAARPDPIPFYGELGSVNPVVVTPAAAVARAVEIADGFVTSVSGSAGQLCTKPGFLLVPAGSTELTERIAAQATRSDGTGCCTPASPPGTPPGATPSWAQAFPSSPRVSVEIERRRDGLGHPDRRADLAARPASGRRRADRRGVRSAVGGGGVHRPGRRDRVGRRAVPRQPHRRPADHRR